MKLRIIYGLFSFILACSLLACSDMNDLHQEYLDEGERIYAAKVDSIFVRPGDGREQIDLYYSAQRITKCVVYWNVRMDSIEFQLPPKGNGGVPIILENMPEDNYAFEIFTFDKYNNRSLVVEASGRVYGHNYKSSLVNPSISNAEFANGNAVIEWGNINPESGVIGVQIIYEDKTNQMQDTIVGVTATTASENTVLPNFLKGSKFQYRTMFMPSELAIDTFYSDYQYQNVKADVTTDYLKNASYPFARSGWDGLRWGSLQDWITNDAMKTRGGNLYGGYDNYQGNHNFGFERWGSGETPIINGKIYQTFTLPAGRYQYVFSYGGGNPTASNNGSDPRYMTVAAGNTLPDVENISTAIAAASLAGVSNSGSRSVEFTLDQPTEVALGVVVKWQNTEQNIRAHHVSLYKLE